MTEIYARHDIEFFCAWYMVTWHVISPEGTFLIILSKIAASINLGLLALPCFPSWHSLIELIIIFFIVNFPH